MNAKLQVRIYVPASLVSMLSSKYEKRTFRGILKILSNNHSEKFTMIKNIKEIQFIPQT